MRAAMRYLTVELGVKTDRNSPINILNGNMMNWNVAFGGNQQNAFEYGFIIECDRLRRNLHDYLGIAGSNCSRYAGFDRRRLFQRHSAGYRDADVANDLGASRAQPQRFNFNHARDRPRDSPDLRRESPGRRIDEGIDCAPADLQARGRNKCHKPQRRQGVSLGVTEMSRGDTAKRERRANNIT